MASPQRNAHPGAVLDSGAFIALERRDAVVARVLAGLDRARVHLVTSGGVIAQVWRGGAGRQAPLALLLSRVEVVPLDANEGRLVGALLGASRTRDAVDGHVALIARERGFPVLTSDVDDLRRIDPRLDLIAI